MYRQVLREIEEQFKNTPWSTSHSWQSIDRKVMIKELLHYRVQVPIWSTDLEELSDTIQPFQPWADEHFERERVSGHPINPGETYKYWREAESAEQHKDEEFSHSYAERYFPQYAGHGNGGHLTGELVEDIKSGRISPHRGIRHSYGGLSDVVKLLAADITTRQAVLPVWFPEDLTAARKRVRVPCSLFYHFICRNGQLDVSYSIRSCDFINHFPDDVYLTMRLCLWVLQEVQKAVVAPDSPWATVVPGQLYMDIGSLHRFKE